MYLRLAAAVFIACFAVFAFAQEAPAPAALTETEQAEIAAAEANNARIVTRPRWVSGPDAEYPDAERALGHHGTVRVRGLLGVDGRVRFAAIEASSGAPVLDQSALASVLASTYAPAKDASGAAIPIMTTVPVGFYSYTSCEGVGAAMYTCQQFVLDMDWWRAAFPEKTFADHQFYLMIRGLGAIARGMSNLESNESFTRRWEQAIETCRDHPDRRFAQAMRPEGEMIDRMQSRYQSQQR